MTKAIVFIYNGTEPSKSTLSDMLCDLRKGQGDYTTGSVSVLDESDIAKAIVGALKSNTDITKTCTERYTPEDRAVIMIGTHYNATNIPFGTWYGKLLRDYARISLIEDNNTISVQDKAIVNAVKILALSNPLSVSKKLLKQYKLTVDNLITIGKIYQYLK